MMYFILAGICWTVGTWDWLCVACLVLGCIDIGNKIIKGYRNVKEKRKDR